MAVAAETVIGSHVLTIDGYTKTTAAHAVGEIIKSQRFRVAGHTWHIECCPRRVDEEGTEWVSVSLWLDHHGAREDDDVKASREFFLLDRAGKKIQSCGLRHVKDTFSTPQCRPDWGYDQFIERKALESYLHIQDDDCCRIRCDVTVIKEPPAATPSQDLHGRNLGDLLLASDVGRDVTFEVDGELFTTHSCVLAARSSTAFMAEVLAGKESAGGSRHVRVDYMCPSVFGALLHFIYTDSLPDLAEGEEANFNVWMAMATDLLRPADRYDIERLKMICTDVLYSNAYASQALPALLLSHKLGCLKLNQACVKYIRNRCLTNLAVPSSLSTLYVH